MIRPLLLISSLLLLAGCAAPEVPPSPPLFAPSWPAGEGETPAPQPTERSLLTPTPNPSVQYYLPGPTPPVASQGVQEPGRIAVPGTFGSPPNVGPVTGYGPGGMAQPPGAPLNPPYPPGGLTGGLLQRP